MFSVLVAVAQSDRTLYKIAEMIPATRATAERLGLVDHRADGQCDCLRAGGIARAGPAKNIDVPGIGALACERCLCLIPLRMSFAKRSQGLRPRRFLTLFETSSIKVDESSLILTAAAGFLVRSKLG